MTPGEATMRAAAAYERGLKPVTHLIDVADEQTAMRLRAAADPAGKDRLAAGSLDDHATDRADAVFARTVLLAERRWNPSGDLDELTAIHKGLFEGVFEDAGKLRTSNTTREVTNDRARAANPEAFFPAGLIETGAHNIAMELADKRNLHALDRDVFVHAFASIYDELGYLHPFRGGNAMVLRIFGSRLAHDAAGISTGLSDARGVSLRQALGISGRHVCTGDDVRRDTTPGESDACVLDRRLESGACTLIAGDCIGLWLIPTP